MHSTCNSQKMVNWFYILKNNLNTSLFFIYVECKSTSVYPIHSSIIYLVIWLVIEVSKFRKHYYESILVLSFYFTEICEEWLRWYGQVQIYAWEKIQFPNTMRKGGRLALDLDRCSYKWFPRFEICARSRTQY